MPRQVPYDVPVVPNVPVSKIEKMVEELSSLSTRLEETVDEAVNNRDDVESALIEIDEGLDQYEEAIRCFNGSLKEITTAKKNILHMAAALQKLLSPKKSTKKTKKKKRKKVLAKVFLFPTVDSLESRSET